MPGKKTLTRTRASTNGHAGIGARKRIRIRMYRVGFGDCFLLSFPEGDHVLVDCGVHQQGDIGTIEAVVTDIEKVTGGKLALVIGTHAHQDHLSGFARCADVFSRFDVREVWLPWTENPNDKTATELRKKRLALTDRLQKHIKALAAANPGASATYAQAREALLNVSSSQVQKALQLLRSGFGSGARVRYLESGRAFTRVAKVTGLAARILGPPTDPEFLAKMDPPSGHHYLALAGVHGDNGSDSHLEAELEAEGDNGADAGDSAGTGDGSAPVLQVIDLDKQRPFADRWSCTPVGKAPLTLEEEKEIQLLSEVPAEGLAFALDQALNNTSLVVLFVYRDKYLLMPGDAQWGNWKWWLDQDEAPDILRQIRFYKVAHHGSVNATPTDALERMTGKEFAAMVSTQSKPWPSIPAPGLMDRLSQRAHKCVVQSDSLSVPGHNDAPKGPLLTKLPKGFRKGPFWFDYSVSV